MTSPRVLAPPPAQGQAHDILSCCPWTDLVRGEARATSMEQVKELDAVLPEYVIEAFVHELKRTKPRDAENIDAANLGIHRGHPLRPLRDLVMANVEHSGTVSTEEALVLWGPTAKSGRVLYRQLGSLLRWKNLETHVTSRPELYGPYDLAALAERWLDAGGVEDSRVLRSAWGLIEDHFLNRRPFETFASLDYAAVALAESAGRGDPRLALACFRALQRIAAWNFRGRIRWRSSWLLGPGRGGPDAIPGASTYWREVRAFLFQRVLRRVEGWSAGQKAATYEVVLMPQRGSYDAQRFAREVGLELGPSGAPRRSTGRNNLQ